MGNTATYDPQPVTTAPEDWSRGVAAAEISLGFGAGVASGLVPGGAVVEQIGTSVGLEHGWIEPHPDLQLGIALGQIFGGLARVVQGGLIIKGGAALSATGVGALAGVPAIAVGAGWAAAGAANVLAGISGLTQALSSGSGSGTPRASAATRGAGSPRVLQSGGNTISNATAKALNEFAGTNLHSREWGRALEALKADLKLGNGHHGKILSNGSYADQAGNVLGNIMEYVQ